MFSPQALDYMNQTYKAARVTPKEARAWAKQHPHSLPDVEEAILHHHVTGTPLYFIDDAVLTEDALDESYYTCERCGNYVLREPLTWGVTQYQTTEDGETFCNVCFAVHVPKKLLGPHGFGGWPVTDGLTWEQFRHALDERAVRDGLAESGWEEYGDGGGDSMSPASTEYAGDSLERTCQRFDSIIRANPGHKWLVTVIQWQFCADVTLWSRKET